LRKKKKGTSEARTLEHPLISVAAPQSKRTSKSSSETALFLVMIIGKGCFTITNAATLNRIEKIRKKRKEKHFFKKRQTFEVRRFEEVLSTRDGKSLLASTEVPDLA